MTWKTFFKRWFSILGILAFLVLFLFWPQFFVYPQAHADQVEAFWLISWLIITVTAVIAANPYIAGNDNTP